MTDELVKKKVLFIDDQLDDWKGLLQRGLTPYGFELFGEKEPEEAINAVDKYNPDVVLLDILFEEEMLGKEILKDIKERYPSLPVIMLTSTLAMDEYDDDDYKLADYRFSKEALAKHDFSSLAERLSRLLQRANKGSESEKGDGSGLSRYGFIVGKTEAMKQLAATIEKIAPTEQTVLVTGESGTGKEFVASALHKLSNRNGSFIPINCGAIPEDLLESELFGHEKGAFTGAASRQQGKVEVAGNGTVFLDEIGELSPKTQVKLLRFLQERKFSRLGSTQEFSSNARIIAATNRDLQAMVQQGDFREDLYYRLNVIPLVLPPLRERKEDIPLFFEYFVKKLGSSSRNAVLPTLRDDVKRLLMAYSWPGNIRQFENRISRAIALAESNVLQRSDFNDLTEEGENTETAFGDMDKVVAHVFNGEISWDKLKTEFSSKSQMRKNLIEGIIKRWMNENGSRPTHKDLASLLGIKKANMRQIIHKCNIKLRQI